MVIRSPQQNRIAAAGSQTRAAFFRHNHGYVAQCILRKPLEPLDLLRMDLACKHAARLAGTLRGRDHERPRSGAHVGHHSSLAPAEYRRQTLRLAPADSMARSEERR